MLDCNYHTHTKRCGHATGEDEDYVLEALGSSFHHLGFSDHVMLPNFNEPGKRGNYELLDDYLDSINRLKVKYKDRITIYLGFEAESFPMYFSYYQELLSNGLIDYLILGNHALMGEDYKIKYNFSNITNASQLYTYRDLAIKAIKTKMFAIFAHPDYFMMSIENFDNDCKKVSRELIETCIAYDVPLEVNVAGIRTGFKRIGNKRRYVYPTDEFFSLVSKYKAKCTIGIDAHKPTNLSDMASNYLAIEFAKRHDLNLIDKVERIKQHL